MASIALTLIGCIDYLAYGSNFTRAIFRPKKIDIFPAKKTVDDHQEVVGWPMDPDFSQKHKRKVM
jgi:hypothetical protein